MNRNLLNDARLTEKQEHQKSAHKSSKSKQELIAWLKLVRDRRWTLKQKHQLLKQFISPEKIYQSMPKQLSALLSGKIKQQSSGFTQAEIEQDLVWLTFSENNLTCINDARYPELLRQVSDPPIVLFSIGDTGLLSDPSVAMVGSRRPSLAGENIAKQIACELTRAGIVVVSGMALGIDGVAHKAALGSDQSTIAVMGAGLDIISPARHRYLFEQIANNGLLLSEYPLGHPASRYTFPQRNRIVSGLSLGVVIVEAAERSGTLITARLAMEQNREVFVVPGSPLNPQYAGSHRLIQQGARLLTNVEDILYDLSIPLQSALQKNRDGQLVSETETILQANASCSETSVLRHIAYDNTPINKIISDSGLTASEVSSMLLILELDGLIAPTRDGAYIRLR